MALDLPDPSMGRRHLSVVAGRRYLARRIAGSTAVAGPTEPFPAGPAQQPLNPKAAVFYVALLPGFIHPQDGRPLVQALILGTIHITISVLIHTTIVLTASRARTVL